MRGVDAQRGYHQPAGPGDDATDHQPPAVDELALAAPERCSGRGQATTDSTQMDAAGAPTAAATGHPKRRHGDGGRRTRAGAGNRRAQCASERRPRRRHWWIARRAGVPPTLWLRRAGVRMRWPIAQLGVWATGVRQALGWRVFPVTDEYGAPTPNGVLWYFSVMDE